MTHHPLLGRLLRRVGVSAAEAPGLEAWQQLLALVSRTYVDADQDRYTLERSIEISSREMQGLYEELKRRSESELAIERARVVESYAVIRATLEAANDGILVVDSKRQVIAANERFGEMTDTRALLHTRDHGTLVAHATKAWGLSDRGLALIEAIHSSNDSYREELALPDGRVIDVYSAPVQLADGRGVGRVTFFRDVTSERRARREIEAGRVAAEAASQAKSMFLANMSHELRTPLNAVIGLADLLVLEGGEPVSDTQREYLDGIAHSGRHLLALVNDVLDLAKIEAGRQELDLEEVAVGEALDEAAAALATLAAHREVALETEVFGDAVPSVRADRLRLRQVLYNLVSNAVKFTNRGGRVCVRARGTRERVAIEVADTGVGIAAEDMPRLYRAFEQLELPSGDRPPGTGLGLALTKRLVEMHGGTIEVASERGVGTTFTVHLPVAA